MLTVMLRSYSQLEVSVKTFLESKSKEVRASDYLGYLAFVFIATKFICIILTGVSPLTILYAKSFQLYFRIFLCLFAGVVVDKLPKVCLYDG